MPRPTSCARPSRSTSTSRSASRSVRIATSSCTRAPRRADLAPGSTTFLIALRAEIALRADALDAAFDADRPPLQTVYFGGGTPSLLSADALAALVALIRERFGIADGAEITLEANPGPDERGDPAGIAAAGVTRLSLGAQSFDGEELRRLGRRHRAGDVADAVAGARAPGSGRSAWTCCTTSPTALSATWIESLEVGARPRAGPPLAVRPDAR